MKILVLWADPNSTNLGSQMLAKGIQLLIENMNKNIEIEFFSHNQIQEIYNGKWYTFQGLIRICKLFSGFDLAIDMGDGDSFTLNYGLRRFLKLSILRFIAGLKCQKLILGPQSIGQFNEIGLLFAKFTMIHVSAVAVRDLESLKNLQRLFRGPHVLSSDVSWIIPTSVTSNKNSKCLINLNGLFHEEYLGRSNNIFKLSIDNLVTALGINGFTFDFLNHVQIDGNQENDSYWEDYIVTKFPSSIIHSPISFYEARNVIAKYNITVGTRYHFCLNSVQVGIPCIPIAYSSKFKSIYHNEKDLTSWSDLISVCEWNKLLHSYSSLDLKDNRRNQELLLNNFAELLSVYLK